MRTSDSKNKKTVGPVPDDKEEHTVFKCRSAEENEKRLMNPGASETVDSENPTCG